MKKIFLIPVSFLALLLVLTGCAKSSQTANKQLGQDINKPGRMRQPDFGQPKRIPDIRGIVKSIVGNEVTVLKIDMPAGGRDASSTPEQASANGNGSTSKNAVSLTGAAGRTNRGGAGRGMMFAGGPGGPGEEQGTETRAQMLAKLKEMSTGEEKIIIPVGIQMLKVDPDNKGQMIEATLADITADKNVIIWLSVANGNVANGNNANIASTTTSTTASTTAVVAERKIAEFVLIN